MNIKRDWLYFHCKLFSHLLGGVPVLSDLNLAQNLYIMVIFIVIILDSTLYIYYISKGSFGSRYHHPSPGHCHLGGDQNTGVITHRKQIRDTKKAGTLLIVEDFVKSSKQ